MSDIFEEVEEGLREDRATSLWRRYRWLVIGIAAALIVGTLVREILVYQETRSQVREAEAFNLAVEEFNAGRFSEAQPLLSTIVDEKGRFAELAGHFLAQAQLAGSGDEAAAREALLAAAEDSDGAFGRLALIKAGYLAADTSSVEELETLLDPLVSTGGRYAALAREVIAARAWQLGDTERARNDFQALQFALDAPRGVQERAEQAIAIIDSRALIETTAPDAASEPDMTETTDEEEQ